MIVDWRHSSSARTLVAVSAVAGAMSYSAFLWAPVARSQLSVFYSFPSELESTGQPYAGWFRVADVVSGVFILLTAITAALLRLRALPRLAAAGLAVGGLCSASDAFTRMECAPSTSAQCRSEDGSISGLFGQALSPHALSGLVGFLGVLSAMWVIGQVSRDVGRLWRLFNLTMAVVLGLVGVTDLVMIYTHGPFGMAERARDLAVSLWLLGLACTLILDSRRVRTAQPRLSHKLLRPASRSVTGES